MHVKTMRDIPKLLDKSDDEAERSADMTGKKIISEPKWGRYTRASQVPDALKVKITAAYKRLGKLAKTAREINEQHPGTNISPSMVRTILFELEKQREREKPAKVKPPKKPALGEPLTLEQLGRDNKAVQSEDEPIKAPTLGVRHEHLAWAVAAVNEAKDLQELVDDYASRYQMDYRDVLKTGKIAK